MAFWLLIALASSLASSTVFFATAELRACARAYTRQQKLSSEQGLSIVVRFTISMWLALCPLPFCSTDDELHRYWQVVPCDRAFPAEVRK